VTMKALICGIVMLILVSVCQAELIAPNMPRKSTEKPKEIPAAPMIKWEKVQISDNTNEGIAVFDVNKDGKLDITAGPNWYEAPKWTPHPLRAVTVEQEEFMSNNTEYGFDVNGDGWTDVIAGSWFTNEIYWYENPGAKGLKAGEPWKQHLIARDIINHEGFLLVDLDGDKIPEIVVNSWNEERPLTVIRIFPGKEPRFEKVEIAKKGWGHGIAVGDLNGDGRPDIIVAKGWFEQPAKDPWTKPWSFQEETWSFKNDNNGIAHASVPGLVMDVNGDGRADLITGLGHSHGLYWFEQGTTGNGPTTWTRHTIDESFSQAHCIIAADLDGSGKPSIITGKRWRGHKDGDPGIGEPMCIFRYIWDPAKEAFVRDTITFDDGVGSGMQIRVADMDGDGKLDIVVAGKTGTYILFNRGPIKTHAPTTAPAKKEKK